MIQVKLFVLLVDNLPKLALPLVLVHCVNRMLYLYESCLKFVFSSVRTGFNVGQKYSRDFSSRRTHGVTDSKCVKYILRGKMLIFNNL